MLKITLIGVPGSGKAELAAALTAALQASACQAAITLSEINAINASAALAADLASHDLVLLMGLVADASAAGQARQAADQRMRAALAESAVPYQVLYGSNVERLDQALRACKALHPPGTPDLGTAQSSQPPSIYEKQPPKPAWVWLCDTCSDPVCEHRLLTDLLARRSAG